MSEHKLIETIMGRTSKDVNAMDANTVVISDGEKTISVAVGLRDAATTNEVPDATARTETVPITTIRAPHPSIPYKRIARAVGIVETRRHDKKMEMIKDLA